MNHAVSVHLSGISNARRSRKRSAGFTLIELLAVLIIVGIMAGVAWPSMSNLGSTRSGLAGRQLLRDLTFARQRAMATGTIHWVAFDTGLGTWSVYVENPSSPGRAGASILTDLANGMPYVTSLATAEFHGVSITSCNFGGGPEIGFNWIGKPLVVGGFDMSTQGVVTLTGGRQVTVEARTGHIRYTP